MNAFDIDFYLWLDGYDDWMFLPPRASTVPWTPMPGVSQADIIAGPAGITFRVDQVLWLGNERDRLPLVVLASELYNTLRVASPGETLGKRAAHAQVRTEIVQGSHAEEVLVSRISEGPATEYLELTARAVGTYYSDFAVPMSLWRSAVNRALDGLAFAVASSPPGVFTESDARFARWLSRRL